MSLRCAVLAALLEGESSGYDLAKRFDLSVANYWSATPQQLYRELDRLTAEGLLTARVVPQEHRPTKRIFALTDAGLAELAAFTAEPPRAPAIRDDLLVKLQALEHGDPAGVAAALRRRLHWSRAKLERYQRLRARLLADRTEDQYLDAAEQLGPYLTVLAGLAFEEQFIAWATRTLTILDRRYGD